jgi:predicted RNase H-like nuclease (RuvC/YqgF family)
MEETHNTLKFASRAKRVEIYAARNRMIDEKSLIKKYQREISSLKQELDQLRRGLIGGASQEEIMILRQQVCSFCYLREKLLEFCGCVCSQLWLFSFRIPMIYAVKLINA